MHYRCLEYGMLVSWPQLAFNLRFRQADLNVGKLTKTRVPCAFMLDYMHDYFCHSLGAWPSTYFKSMVDQSR